MSQSNSLNAASYESFKILRGVPLCNSVNPANNNVWLAAIPSLPGKTPDPNNYIKYGVYQNVITPSNIPNNPNLSNTLIVDSTRIIVQNLVNNNYIDLLQEDAYCTFVSNYTCLPPVPTPVNPCAVVPPTVCVPDGVLQFIAIVSIAPSCTWLGTGLVITISPLNSSILFQNCTYGNWCPFSFSIGNCNSQSSVASLLYLTCALPSGYGYFYDANYANVRFTLLNKQKCATGGAKKACYLGVDSLDKSSFLVFFGQQRLIGTAQILLISPIVDLKAIIWQPVFIITTNTPLSLTCGYN